LVGLVCWSCVCFVSFFVPKNGGLILAQYWPLAHYCPSVVTGKIECGHLSEIRVSSYQI
jgi:hypothetical protein